MIAVMLRESPSKRLKLTVDADVSTAIDHDEEFSDNSTLGGIEDDENYEEDEGEDEDEEDDDHPQVRAREDSLLDHVLAIYDQCEECSLVEQNRTRCKLTTCTNKSKSVALRTQLSDAKIKCSLLKVLTLLAQSDSSRLKGCTHADRMDLMRRVKLMLLDHHRYSVNDLKRQFVLLVASTRKDLFPPCSIAIPTTDEAQLGAPKVVLGVMDQQSLNRETKRIMSRLEELAQKALQQRLANGNWNHSIKPTFLSDDEDDHQDWESIREVWYVWLQFPAKASQQLEIWQETLASNEPLSSLLWNLSFYLSMEDSFTTSKAF